MKGLIALAAGVAMVVARTGRHSVLADAGGSGAGAGQRQAGPKVQRRHICPRQEGVRIHGFISPLGRLELKNKSLAVLIALCLILAQHSPTKSRPYT